MTKAEEELWPTLQKMIRKTAANVCDRRNKQMNLWMSRHSDEHEKLHGKRTSLLKERIQCRKDDIFDRVENLKQHDQILSKNLQSKMREWEEEWWNWNELAEECKEAKGQIGKMYSLLNLQRRWTYNNSSSVSFFSGEEFKHHLQKIPLKSERHGNDPQEIVPLMERINLSQEREETIKAANGKVSRSLNAAEIIADHNKMRLGGG